MATTFSENFETQTVGILPSGWTLHSGNSAWTVVNSGALFGSRSLKCGTAGQSGVVAYTAPATRSDFAVQLTTQVQKTGSNYYDCSPLIRTDDSSNNYYRVLINWVAGTAQFYRVNTALGTSFAVGTFDNLSLVKVKLEAEGTTLRCRIWDANGTEPGTWNGTTTDAVIASGKGGVSGHSNNGYGQGIIDDYFEGDVGTTFGIPTQSIATNNAAIFYSPYTWVTDGSNARTNNCGAYVKVPFTGTQLFALVNQTSSSVKIRYKVDQYNWTTVTLPSGVSQVNIGSGLPSGNHLAELWVIGVNISNDRWGSVGVPPTESLNITSWGIDQAASMGTYTPKPKRMIFYCDSIGEGIAADYPANDSHNWVPPLAYALDAEHGVVAFGGWGYLNGAQGGVPTLAAAWDLQYAGVSRLSSGLFSPAPDYLLCTHGVNSGGATSTVIRDQITAFRAAGSATRMFIAIPLGQQELTNITAGFNAYQALGTDNKAHLINLGTDIGIGLANSGNTTFSSGDGLHPRLTYCPRIASAFTKAIQAIIDSASSSTGSPLILSY